MYKNKKRYFWLLLALLIAIPAVKIHAEGSRELTANGGRRAFLRSSTNTTDNWPFPNQGTHYVYAKAGEYITMASSLQGTGATDAKRLKLYSPTGMDVTPANFNGGGNISDRTAEVAGPLTFSETANGNKYKPVYYQVPTGGAGIYRVEFISTSNTMISESLDSSANNLGQTPASQAVTIAAWDVSVQKTTADGGGFAKGRVYTNVLNLSNGNTNPNNTGFYGIVYVKTKDGYTYRVNNNGNNGMYFTFFANNNGFVDATTQLPIYKSLNTTSNLATQVHNPNNADAGTHITHKVFYSLPATDMPVSANISLGSATSTWLNPAPVVPGVTTPVIKGADGTFGQVSSKGGYIEFTADVQGNYKIEIISNNNPAVFPTRTLIGQASAGLNSVLWDGKDGTGNPLPAGEAPVKVTVQLQGAEVHFPFFDMEYNTKGTIIELLNKDNLSQATSDIVYWNDTDIPNVNNGTNPNPKNNSHLPPTNSSGISSNTNGHIWGVLGSGTSGQFGDNKSIDTWTFITGERKEIQTTVAVKKADLYVNVTSDKTTLSVGETVTYTVKAGSMAGTGYSDVTGAPFTFTLPEGFDGSTTVTPVFSGNSCGTQSTAITYNPATRTYTSALNLPVGCEVTYTITAKVAASATTGSNSAEATILRPADVSDPNATNRSDSSKPTAVSPTMQTNVDDYYVPPFDAHYECANRPAGETAPCNNIASTAVTVEANSTVAIDDFIETPLNTPVSGNVLDNDYDPQGDTQAVNSTGSFTTSHGGTIVINANGTYTYTPANGFSGLDNYEYEVCDNHNPKACATATLTIGVGVCTEAVNGEKFNWSQNGGNSPVTKTITQPASNYGFTFDIYKLDNSFNMEINGTKIAVNELEFQSNLTPGINVKFKDGSQYEANTQKIWEMTGTAAKPLIRVVISPTGSVNLWGSKTSGGELFPLALSANAQGQNYFNNIPWNSDGINTIIVTQNVVGVTLMDGYGYGQNIIPCPNYWMGGTPGKLNEWNEPANWTDNKVPLLRQDIEFATVANYGTAAKEDLYLDNLDQDATGGRVIGNLINDSGKDLVITTGNQLTINGEVKDNNPDAGTIVVKSSPDAPTGTLIFADPSKNQAVGAVVEFYNQAYDCADCGFYRKSWQYFGIPVSSSAFPYGDVAGEETVNQWVEPFNGNKWQPAPYAPDTQLKAFKGYEITNSSNTQPTGVYRFAGTLNVGDASVPLTKTANVNYSGANLASNSYTAAIAIKDAFSFAPDITDKSVYLFNTGTRDQWRKLNGSEISQNGYKSGQYLAVPFNLAGQGNLPDRIPSMHAFMILSDQATANLSIKYDRLVKNTTVNRGDGTQIVTRSATATGNESSSAPAGTTLPSLTMDVIGRQSADRVWIFAKQETTYGFDNGWDGRKMSEDGIAQLYVSGTDEGRFQVATVPGLNDVSIGFEPDEDGKYTLEFSLSAQLKSGETYIVDMLTGAKQRITDGSSYVFEAKKGDSPNRFRLTRSGETASDGGESLLFVEALTDGKIKISNGSPKACSAFVSDGNGKFLQRMEVPANSQRVTETMPGGVYLIRLQNAGINDVRRIEVK